MAAALASAPAAARRPTMSLSRVSKVYGMGEIAVHALRNVDFEVEQGDYVAIMGRSGSGKSTLMNIVGCLDVPTSGTYLLDGVDVGDLDDGELSFVRNRRIGLVFQSFNLIARTTVLRNVELPLIYGRINPKQRRKTALSAIEAVGLTDRVDHVPSELSGGQQQRVAIARAIVTDPAIILADEPTGNLDSTSTAEVLEIFSRLNASGRTIVLITHETEVAAHCKRVIHLTDGRVDSDVRTASLHAGAHAVALPPIAPVPA